MSLLVAAALSLAAAGPVRAQGSNEALLRLLHILKDRGSITVDEYEELRVAAGGPPAVPVAASPPAPPPPDPAPIASSANAPAARGLASGSQATRR